MSNKEKLMMRLIQKTLRNVLSIGHAIVEGNLKMQLTKIPHTRGHKSAIQCEKWFLLQIIFSSFVLVHHPPHITHFFFTFLTAIVSHLIIHNWLFFLFHSLRDVISWSSIHFDSLHDDEVKFFSHSFTK